RITVQQKSVDLSRPSRHGKQRIIVEIANQGEGQSPDWGVQLNEKVYHFLPTAFEAAASEEIKFKADCASVCG
ncbi:AAEL011351-PA, partial [Aedes aegypti]